MNLILSGAALRTEVALSQTCQDSVSSLRLIFSFPEKRNFFWNRMDHMLQESQFTRGVRERLLRLGSNPMSSCNSYLQKVPAIVHGNLKLFESHAILVYLASAFTGIADH
ncbi:uncharacterized protein LOC107637960 isoform X2 [Arachis ipaensis]|uniref:uncharacterized protein LOC107637960 isoform X2 n=1 Tax=Arachis ipaensis TaxID=130454 RepID=UPI000A2B938F|nr:uncharacterized protein LOC107637960 isoform X2 [Arachis ipaensis]